MCGSKLASGAWFLLFLPGTTVTLDTNFVILGVQNPSFGCLSPPLYRPGDHFVSLGTPWGTMRAAGRTRGVRSKIFSDFGLILGPHFESFLNSDGLIKFCVFLKLVSRSLFASIF
jgi:hypothetical protein